jgi:hypothetical protein
MININDWKTALAAGLTIIVVVVIVLSFALVFLRRGGRLRGKGLELRQGDALAQLVPYVKALVEIQPHIIKAGKKQNAALREIGANGSTLESDTEFDEAQKCLDSLLTSRVEICS